MAECQKSKAEDFETFCDFFTRKLKKNIHIIDKKKDSIVSSCDGKILEYGKIKDNTMVQFKGMTMNINNLVGNDKDLENRFINGSYVTIYLSPRDYHRVHMPLQGRLLKTIHLPGRLYSVAQHAVKSIKNLYTRNERLICSFDNSSMLFSVVFIGAINVSSIEVTWKGEASPPLPKKDIRTDYKRKKIVINKGEELGMFKTGSTIILLFDKKVELSNDLKKGKPIRVGNRIGNITKSIK